MSARGTSTATRTRPTQRRSRSTRPRPGTTRTSRPSPALRPRRRKPLIITAVVAVLALLLGWLLFFSSVLGVSAVQVTGSQLVTQEQVEQALAITPGTPLLRLDTDELEERVASIPAVGDVTVSRSWPSTVVVEITDRVPVATVEIDGVSWLLDETGAAYAETSAATEDQAAALLPVELTDPGPDDLATREAIAVLLGLPQEIRDQVSSISAPGPAEVTLHLADGRTVIWGDSSRMADKVTMLPGVLEHSGNTFDISSPQAIVIS